MSKELLMSTIEMKRELISRIQAIEETDVLQDIYSLLEIDSNPQEIYRLSDEQKQVVAESRNQIKQGHFYSNEDVKQEAKKWLKE